MLYGNNCFTKKIGDSLLNINFHELIRQIILNEVLFRDDKILFQTYLDEEATSPWEPR